MRKVEVLVVGAGPVGAIAAARLSSMGIDVMLCEEQASCAHDLRASTFHPATIEMLDQLGAAEPLIAQGLKAPVYHVRDRQTAHTLAFDLTELSDHTKFPYRLQCEQYYMANLLAERVATEPNVELHFGARFVSAQEDGEGVVATFEKDGAQFEVAAKFLIGADGSRSAVRKGMGVGFEGFTYEEKFVSLSTAFPIEEVMPNLAYVNYISDPKEWLVLLRVPTLWRVLVPAAGSETNEWLTSDEKAAEVFSRIVGDIPVVTRHRTIYRVHQRVAETFVKGRRVIVGDAAHLNNPLGGFGMNSGVHDAWNLTEKLWAILRKDGSPDLLGVFDRQRRTVTKSFIQTQTMENMALMEQGPGEASRLRRERMENIHADPELRRQYLMRQAMFQSLEEAAGVQ